LYSNNFIGIESVGNIGKWDAKYIAKSVVCLTSSKPLSIIFAFILAPFNKTRARQTASMAALVVDKIFMSRMKKLELLNQQN